MELLRTFQRVSLCLFFFTMNFETFEAFSIADFSLTKLAGFIYLITIIPEIKFFFRIDHLEKVLLLLTIFFLLLTLVSLFNVNEFSFTFFNLTIFQNILLFWFLANHARKDYLILEKAMLFFAFGCFIISLFYLANIGVEYEGGRLSMFKENQNTLGIRMNLGILILMLAVVQNKLHLGPIRYLFLVPVPLLMNLLLASGSRVALISFVLCIIAATLMLRTQNTFFKVITVIAGFIFLFLIIIMIMQSTLLRERILESVEGNLSGRDKIWKNLIPLIGEYPFFGVGQTGYDYYSLIIFGKYRSPHNVILEVLCLTGFIGLIIYLFFLFNVFKKGLKVYHQEGLLLPILFIIPVSGLLLSGQILSQKMGWAIFAYIIGSNAIKFKDILNNKKLGNAYPLCY